MGIEPIRAATVVSANLVSGAVFTDGASDRAAPGTAAAAPAGNLQSLINREILNLAPDPKTAQARREQLRARQEAKQIVRKALREQAAIQARIREKLREEAAIEDAADDRARLGYTASELREIFKTARRLNIQA